MRLLRISALIASLLTLVLAAARAGPGPAPGGLPPTGRRITPGVQMFTDGAQCTGNFVYTDDAGHVFVGYAAHCAGRGGQTDTDGCSTGVPTPRHPGPVRPGGDGGHPRAPPWATARSSTARGSPCTGPGPRRTTRAPTTTSHWCGSDPDGRRQGQPVGPVLGRPDRRLSGRCPGRARRSTPGAQSSLRPTTALSPKTGSSLGGGAGGLDLGRLHGHPGHPRRLRQRVPRRPRPRARRPLHRGHRTARRLQRGRGPRGTSWPSPRPTRVSPACAWCPGTDVVHGTAVTSLS